MGATAWCPPRRRFPRDFLDLGQRALATVSAAIRVSLMTSAACDVIATWLLGTSRTCNGARSTRTVRLVEGSTSSLRSLSGSEPVGTRTRPRKRCARQLGAGDERLSRREFEHSGECLLVEHSLHCVVGAPWNPPILPRQAGAHSFELNCTHGTTFERSSRRTRRFSSPSGFDAVTTRVIGSDAVASGQGLSASTHGCCVLVSEWPQKKARA
jgi:hypothetical protein